MLALDKVHVGSATEMLDPLIDGFPDVLNRGIEGDSIRCHHLTSFEWVGTLDLEGDVNGVRRRLATIFVVMWHNQ